LNATRALAIPRCAARKIAPQLQRMAAEDLWPSSFRSGACAENLTGPLRFPASSGSQLFAIGLEEAMDIRGLEELLRSIEVATQADRARND